MRARTAFAALMLLLISCSSTTGPAGSTCAIRIAGTETANLACAAAVTSSATDTLRVMNVADPPSQPLSVQLVCSTPSPIAAGTYTLPVAGTSGSGCGVIVQQFAADLSVQRLWQAQPGRGATSITITDVTSADGGVHVAGHGTATAVETSPTTGMELAGSDLTLTFTF